MGRSRDDLLHRIKRKVEDFSSFSEHSRSEEKYKCHKQLSRSISEYFTTSSEEDAEEEELSSVLKETCDYSPFEKMMTRDIHWFSMSSFKKGLTHSIGSMLLKIAAQQRKTVQTFSNILIRISCMVFQWNNSSESLTHATLFLVFLRDLLLLHPDTPTDTDCSLLQALHTSLLNEMKQTKKSPPNVIETRVFMIFSTLKTVLLAKPNFPVTETLVSLFYFAAQLKHMPKICDSNSTSSQHVSFRLQKLFVDGDAVTDRRPLSRMSQQNCLDLSSEYHISDHQTIAQSDTVYTPSSSSAVAANRDTSRMSLRKENKSSGIGACVSARPSLEKWLPKELRNWILIRRHPFTSSSLSGVLSHLLRGWALESYDTGRYLFEHLDRTVVPLLHMLLGPPKRKPMQKEKQRDGDTESESESESECEGDTQGNAVVSQRMGGAWMQAVIQVMVVSVVQSPVLYMHSLLEKTCRAICHYYECNFTVDPAREGYYVPSGVDKEEKKKKKKKRHKKERDRTSEWQDGYDINGTTPTPMAAVNGLKVGCHILSTLLAHFTCVSAKDVVYGVIFLSNLIDNSITLWRQRRFTSERCNLLPACTEMLSSYLAYILIHTHHVIHTEIFTCRNILLRDMLIALYEDSLTAESGDDGEYDGDCSLNKIKSPAAVYSKEDSPHGERTDSSSSSIKCIYSTHPLLSSYLCAITMPRLGISCTCTPLHSSQFEGTSAVKDWFEHQVQRQAHHFSTPDLLSLDLSLLWSSSAECHSSTRGGPEVAAFPIQQWPCFHMTEGGGSGFPNIHTFYRNDNDMKDASVGFILQSRLHVLLVNTEEAHMEEDDEVDSVDQRRLVDVADRVFAYDICVVVMEYVSFKRVCRLACVNKQFALAAACPLVWARKYKDKFGVPLFDIRPVPSVPTKHKVKTKNKQNEGVGVEVVQVPVSPLVTKAQLPELLCQHCYPSDPTSLSVATTARSKQITCCDGLAKQHNWLHLFQVIPISTDHLFNLYE